MHTIINYNHNNKAVYCYRLLTEYCFDVKVTSVYKGRFI